MPLYFAYGSNMDRNAMNARCPSSVPLGVGSLSGFRFVITLDGYASVDPHPGSTVYGFVWELDPRDETELDEYEEVSLGLYTKTILAVRTAGFDREALVYIGQGRHPGLPKSGYMECVLAAAEAGGLPQSHLDELRRWLPTSGGPGL